MRGHFLHPQLLPALSWGVVRCCKTTASQKRSPENKHKAIPKILPQPSVGGQPSRSSWGSGEGLVQAALPACLPAPSPAARQEHHKPNRFAPLPPSPTLSTAVPWWKGLRADVFHVHAPSSARFPLPQGAPGGSQARGPTTLTAMTLPLTPMVSRASLLPQKPSQTLRPSREHAQRLVLTFEPPHPHWTWRAKVSLVPFQATWSWWSSLPR